VNDWNKHEFDQEEQKGALQTRGWVTKESRPQCPNRAMVVNQGETKQMFCFFHASFMSKTRNMDSMSSSVNPR
jgi:hypothetical protein